MAGVLGGAPGGTVARADVYLTVPLPNGRGCPILDQAAAQQAQRLVPFIR
ncbi:hypothetical protein FAIPA1_10039 [Frankia sp. AiPs1]|nr:hypothetical protein [Frankia sp. AiPa1]MCL9762003.1 hypothetical protein [Frankia sp. AiPa1]